jgi:multidrug resistance efflux pump
VTNLFKERAIQFLRTQAFRIGISLLMPLALVLAISDPLSRAISIRTHGSAATVFPATIRPHRITAISSEFPGHVAESYIAVGKTVKVNDSLIVLSNPDLDLEYERAKVHLDVVMRRLNGLSGPQERPEMSRVERELEAAKERLSQFSLETIQSNYDKAAAHQQEIQKLVDQGLATAAELEEARRTAAYALRDLQSEREHLSRLQEQADVAALSVGNEQRLFQAPRSAEHLNLAMELQEAQAAFRVASHRRDSQRIIATSSGTILKVMVNVGDQIPSGVPLVQIGQMDQIDFSVPVDPLVARSLRVGQRVKVRIPTEPPEQISAPIASISLAPSQEQSAYTVIITVLNPAPYDLLAGLAAEVEFPQ